ncbi:hypothetical protein BH09VER1_BH09VER1_15870 [soil metagenome]
MRPVRRVKPLQILCKLGALAATFLLGACATHTSVVETAGITGQYLPIKKAQPVVTSAKPFRTISLQPTVEEKIEGKPVRTIDLTRSQQIALLVHNGILVEGSESLLFFVRSRSVLSSPSGLFEDAVTLANLRQRLKDVKDLPDCISSTATVQDATAFIKLDEEIPVASGANAIDAALKAKGVVAVRARILNPVRL